MLFDTIWRPVDNLYKGQIILIKINYIYFFLKKVNNNKE